MLPENLSITVEYKLTSEIRADIADWLTSADLFNMGCAGYWAYGADQCSRGWLIYDHGSDEGQGPTEVETAEAMARWLTGKAVEAPWHVLDLDAALEMVKTLIERHGVLNWDPDASDLDVALQTVLFGGVVYG